MKTQQVIKLAIRFLEELGDRYANDSCNDLFLDINGANMIIAQEIAERCGEDVSIVTHKSKDMISLFNSDLLNLCIDKLKELDETTYEEKERNMPLHFEYSFCGEPPTKRCKGKPKTDRQYNRGEYLGNICIKGGIRWAIVLWDGEDGLDLYKADMLLIEHKQWMPIDQ